jgi:hypothetical protein
MINEVKTYIDDKGRIIKAKVPFTGSCDVFVKPTYIGITTTYTVYGEIPVRFEFPEGFTLEECFDKFDQYANDFRCKCEEKEEEINKIKNS